VSNHYPPAPEKKLDVDTYRTVSLLLTHLKFLEMKLQFNKHKRDGTPVYYFLDVVQENGEAKEFCIPTAINPAGTLEWDDKHQQFKENQPESKEVNERLKLTDKLLKEVFEEQFSWVTTTGSSDFEIKHFKYLLKKKGDMMLK
jgi:hypothetical protein